MKFYGPEIKQAVCYTANYKDFDGNVEKWREAYFQLLAWKNTWCLPYQMDICSHRDHVPYLFLVIGKSHEEKTDELLADLGYKFSKSDCSVGIVSSNIDVDFCYFD